jgi:hypothetical protein
MDWPSFLWGFGICGLLALWIASGTEDSSTNFESKRQAFDLQEENRRLHEANERLLSAVTKLAIKKMEGEPDAK